MALEQEIIELVKLSATEDIRDTGFSFSWISIGSRSLIIIKSVSKLAEYYGQLFINIIALIVKIADDGLYFILFSLFISFYFSIFRTTRVRGYQSRCHISHKLMAKSQDWL